MVRLRETIIILYINTTGSTSNEHVRNCIFHFVIIKISLVIFLSIVCNN